VLGNEPDDARGPSERDLRNTQAEHLDDKLAREGSARAGLSEGLRHVLRNVVDALILFAEGLDDGLGGDNPYIGTLKGLDDDLGYAPLSHIA
jgi:hypothetical protein